MVVYNLLYYATLPPMTRPNLRMNKELAERSLMELATKCYRFTVGQAVKTDKKLATPNTKMLMLTTEEPLHPLPEQ
ncbi:hypothetical protein RvY_06501 [Ramazzottius varieornatus]|uniref:Uncharacterized protein n=1 Tax=Ramazzottius varieornatus TaxID=947166 RepID=A0A1D1UYU1_RAMVA|nr:hypothetical protein RvY_06501 [Ramazzottius varieornatus]